jgi:hypothetical protein
LVREVAAKEGATATPTAEIPSPDVPPINIFFHYKKKTCIYNLGPKFIAA